MAATSYGVKGTELGVTYMPSSAAAVGTRPVVLWSHGHGTAGLHALTVNDFYLRPLAEAGYAIIATDLAGPANWGNDAAQTGLTDSRAYGQGPLGGKTGPAAGIGSSLGALPLLNLARTHPDWFACLLLLVPITDLAYQHDVNPNGWASEIEAAYGGASGYTAAVASHDPQQNTAAHRTGPPIKMWRASNDPTAATARQDAFATATGCGVRDLGLVGHSTLTVDPGELVAFLGEHL